MSDLFERRLKTSEDIRAGLVAEIHRQHAEIERLRAENHRLHSHIYASNRPQPEEIERLTAAAEVGEPTALEIENAKLRGHIAANDWTVETAYKMQVAATIERCAQVVENFRETDPYQILVDIAAEIRALKASLAARPIKGNPGKDQCEDD